MLGLSSLVRSRLPVLALLLGVLLAGGAFTVAGAGGYSLSVADSGNGIDAVDVPSRTVTIEGSEYTVSEVGRVDPGEAIAVRVGAPSGETVDVQLRRPDTSIDQSDSGVSDGETVSFSSDNLSPGTYYATVYTDGQTRTVVPVVVSGYDVAVTDAPDRVARGEPATVRASVSATASSGDPHRVEVVVGDDDRAVRVNASRSNGDYVAEVPTGDLPPGEYAAYAVVRGEEEARDGEKEIVGVSDRRTLTVADGDATPTPTGDGGTGSGDGSSGDGSGGASDANRTATPTPAGPTPTAAGSTETTPTPSPTPSQADPSAPGATPTATPTDGSITTPAPEPTGTPTPARTGGQPGLGAVAGLAAVVAVGGLLRRRTGR